MMVHSSHKMPKPLWQKPDDDNRFINEFPRCERCENFLGLERPCEKAPKHKQRNGTVLVLS